MAQVNVDLSEYDMLRQSKEKAEAEVKDLREEVKKLKDNAANVVVKNRYYVPALDYKTAASRILQNLGTKGAQRLMYCADQMAYSAMNDPFGRPYIDSNVTSQLATIIENGVKDLLNLKATYIEDSVSMEVRGFDEFATQVREKYEIEYKTVMEEKKAQLEREIELYSVQHLEVDKAVKEAENSFKQKYDKEIEKLEKKIEKQEEIISDLKDKLKEASKSSEEKLAEAMAKLKVAEEEVAKYSKPKKRLFGLFG